ncbi:MAG TPA: glycosyltransferase [Isosphaeraceae bacterium]|nr:glycosyltransferase [Isosphaeraceae bacterium]
MTNLILGITALVGAGSTLAAMACLFWFTRKRTNLPEHTPPVSVLKPLKGMDEGLEANLRSFFEQDYPAYQLIFGVADAEDPAIGVVKRLMEAYPHQDATIVVGAPAFGLNPKVENLAAMETRRKHDVILISDSNVRVKPEYLRETACYLADPSVGLVTNIFAGVGEKRLGASLENLQLNGFVAGNLAAAFALRITCVVGKSMMMPVKALEAIGGLESVRNLLAEDQAIGVKVRKAGYAIRLSHHVIDNVNESRDLKWFLNRHSRWLKIRYQMATATYLIEPLSNLTLLGLLWAFASGSPMAWGGLAALWTLGVARDAVQAKWLRGSFPKLRDLPLSLVKDLFMLPIWLDSLVNRKITWRGHKLVVGRFTRLRVARVPRAVKDRVRRVRRLRHQNPSEPE